MAEVEYRTLEVRAGLIYNQKMNSAINCPMFSSPGKIVTCNNGCAWFCVEEGIAKCGQKVIGKLVEIS